MARSAPRLSLSCPEWPAADRAAWQTAMTPGDLFDGNGPAASWARSTQAAVRFDYGRWLMFLARHEPDALDQPVATRVTPTRIQAYLSHLAVTVGTVGRHSYLRHLRDALRVMIPDQDWSWLGRVVAQLEAQRRPRPKLPRLVDAGRLSELGYTLMDDAERQLAQDARDTDALLAYRDGLMIAMLAARPLRRRNFAAIAIDHHLLLIGGQWRLVFAAEETKTGQPIEVILPDRLGPWLERYLSQVRPRFPRAGYHNGLWAGLKGCPLTGQAIYATISERTRAAFGHAVNPHLFRDCAATTIAITAPESIGIARDLLSHASLATTEKYYNQARSIDASRLLARALDRHRDT
jgi:integrase